MTAVQLAGNEFELLNSLGEERDVTCGICCDLLSWVMAKGQRGMAWVTVQTHMNVVAVASLHEFSCIILAEGCRMAPEVPKKAEAEGIAVLSSPMSEYKICAMLHDMGIG